MGRVHSQRPTQRRDGGERLVLRRAGSLQKPEEEDGILTCTPREKNPVRGLIGGPGDALFPADCKIKSCLATVIICSTNNLSK